MARRGDAPAGPGLQRRQFLKAAGVLAVAGSAVPLVGCGSGDSGTSGAAGPSGGNAGAAAKRVRIGQTSPPLISYPGVVWGPVTYGKDYGIPVAKEDFTTFESHSTAMQTLLSGQADVVIGSLLSTLALSVQRKDFRAFGPSIELDDFVLAGVGTVDSCEAVRSPQTKVAIDSPGGSGSAVLEAILVNTCNYSQSELGNVQIIESSGLRTTSLGAKQTQASVIHLDQLDELKKQLGEEQVHEIAGLFDVQRFIRSAMASTGAWLDANKEVAAGLAAATFKGHRVLMTDYDAFTAAVRDVVEEPPEDEAAYKRTWDLCRTYRFWPVNAAETLDQSGIEFMAEIGKSSGAIKGEPDVAGLVHREILQMADEMVGPATREQLLSS